MTPKPLPGAGRFLLIVTDQNQVPVVSLWWSLAQMRQEVTRVLKTFADQKAYPIATSGNMIKLVDGVWAPTGSISVWKIEH